MDAKLTGEIDGKNCRIAHELTNTVLSGQDLLQFAGSRASSYSIGAIFSNKRTETSESDYLVSFLSGYKGVKVFLQEQHQGEGDQPKDTFNEDVSANYDDIREDGKKKPLWTRILKW